MRVVVSCDCPQRVHMDETGRGGEEGDLMEGTVKKNSETELTTSVLTKDPKHTRG